MRIYFAICLFFLASPTIACTCLSRTPESSYQDNSFVGIGHVISIKLEPDRVNYIAIAVIDETLKGKHSKKLKIKGVSEADTCGSNLQIGGDYVFFTNGKIAFHSACSRQLSLVTTIRDPLRGLIREWRRRYLTTQSR
jgi:hypothetical protein